MKIDLTPEQRRFVATCRSGVALSDAYHRGRVDATNELYRQFIAGVVADGGNAAGNLSYDVTPEGDAIVSQE